ASRRARGLEPWTVRRDQAYLGVLVDDLITRGTLEPYRMFTSRAEHRLILREDNADLRLTEIGRQLGLVDDTRWEAFSRKREAIEREQRRLSAIWLNPQMPASERIRELTGHALSREYNALELIRRPALDYYSVTALPGVGSPVKEPAVAEQIEIQTKYAGYVERQTQEIESNRAQENTPIPVNLDYSCIRGLSSEIRQKLTAHRPETLGQAARIPGMTPAAISILRICLKRGKLLKKTA
ncbi:MAG TPA: tRNA uridine-5-carboxymethylaminomethyl(34) synthesis enzyme MnmG, partial [Gammaproteobacteria bacterium]